MFVCIVYVWCFFLLFPYLFMCLVFLFRSSGKGSGISCNTSTPMECVLCQLSLLWLCGGVHTHTRTPFPSSLSRPVSGDSERHIFYHFDPSVKWGLKTKKRSRHERSRENRRRQQLQTLKKTLQFCQHRSNTTTSCCAVTWRHLCDFHPSEFSYKHPEATNDFKGRFRKWMTCFVLKFETLVI